MTSTDEKQEKAVAGPRRVLLSDTSSERCAVTLVEVPGGAGKGAPRVLGHLDLGLGLQHAIVYQNSVKALLELAQLSPEDVDVWAAVTGPGSFTGLRIAVAATKVSAYLTGAACLGINALEARAWTLLREAGARGPVKTGGASETPNGSTKRALAVPILDSRNERCWSGLYLWDEAEGRAHSLREVHSGEVSDLAEEVARVVQDEGVGRVAIGGLKLPRTCADAFREALGPDLPWTLDEGCGLRAEDLAALLSQKLRDDDCVSPEDLAVNYFSLSQAERQLAERSGESPDLPAPDLRSEGRA